MNCPKCGSILQAERHYIYDEYGTLVDEECCVICDECGADYG